MCQGRGEREKDFEDQCKKLDSILDTNGDLGMMGHKVQIAHASTGTGLGAAASMTSLGIVTSGKETGPTSQ